MFFQINNVALTEMCGTFTMKDVENMEDELKILNEALKFCQCIYFVSMGKNFLR